MENNQQPKPKHQAGKGSKPRNIFSKNFRDNWEQIDWSKKKSETSPINSDSTQSSLGS